MHAAAPFSTHFQDTFDSIHPLCSLTMGHKASLFLPLSPSRQSEPRFSDRPLRLWIFSRNFHVVNALSQSEPGHGEKPLLDSNTAPKKLQTILDWSQTGTANAADAHRHRRAYGSDSIALVTAAIAVHSCGMRASALCSATSKPHSWGEVNTFSTLSS